jgi:purine-binding chemotaxis protein CheW
MSNEPQPFLTFSLGEQKYALPIDVVVEVAAMVELSEVAESPPEMSGIANRHGLVLPVFDLRLVFGHVAARVNLSTLFIVAAHDGQTVGLVVDDVHQVEYLQPSHQIPTTGKHIHDIVSHKGQLVQMICLPALLETFAGIRYFEGHD